MDFINHTLIIGIAILIGAFPIVVEATEEYVAKKVKKYIHSLPSAKVVGKALCIPYRFYGRIYQVIVPFDLDTYSDLSLYKCYAIHDAYCIDITNQPGIPYMVKAPDLGVDTLHLVNEDDESTHVFDQTIPKVKGFN